MEKMKRFTEFFDRKERIKKPEVKPEDNYKEHGFCQGHCDRKVIPDSKGEPMVVCDFCKRIVMKRPNR